MHYRHIKPDSTRRAMILAGLLKRGSLFLLVVGAGKLSFDAIFGRPH